VFNLHSVTNVVLEPPPEFIVLRERTWRQKWMRVVRLPLVTTTTYKSTWSKHTPTSNGNHITQPPRLHRTLQQTHKVQGPMSVC